MDVEKSLRMAVEGGKVEFGTRSGVKSAATAKIVLIASNCPSETRKKIEKQCAASGVAVHMYDGTSVELGTACGKPFPVSVLSVLDAGASNILDLGKPKAEAQAAAASEERAEAHETAEVPAAETKMGAGQQ